MVAYRRDGWWSYRSLTTELLVQCEGHSADFPHVSLAILQQKALPGVQCLQRMSPTSTHTAIKKKLCGAKSEHPKIQHRKRPTQTLYMPIPHGESYSNHMTQTVCTTEELASKHIQSALCPWARDREMSQELLSCNV